MITQYLFVKIVGISVLSVYILAVFVSYAKGTKPEERIVGGEFASPGEFPHQIQIIDRAERMKILCGGSLIHQEWVLTAAHCLADKPGADGLNAFIIIAGRYYGPSENIRDSTEQTHRAKEIFVHPCYSENTIVPPFDNDIALIKLDTPFTLNERVKLIQLDEKGRANPGSQTTAIGWGTTNPVTMDFPPKLKKATLLLPQDGFCDKLASSDTESQISVCLNETDSICFGDSGGPLLCNDGGVNYICGISSLLGQTCSGASCVGAFKRPLCVDGYNVFIRVFYFKDWIKEVMKTGRNSETNCVLPKVTVVPEVTRTIPTRSRGHILYKQSVHGFYIATILVSCLYTC